MSALELSVVVAYALLLLVLSVYGSHRYAMAYLYFRHKFRLPTPKGRFERLPRVTIQLPDLQRDVRGGAAHRRRRADRLPARPARDPGPRRLDRRDAGRSPAPCVERHRAHGSRHRTTSTAPNRTGFKAGALEHGLTLAKGELVAVFDADFVPEPDFLRGRSTSSPIRGVGMVQARWGHLNRDVLAPHPGAGHPARRPLHHRAHARATARGRFFNFNGTAGIWRRAGDRGAAAAGSTTRSPRTSTSPTARSSQGWRFVYLPDLVTPGRAAGGHERLQEPAAPLGEGLDPDRAEAPAARSAARTLPKEVKREAFFHLTANLAYLLMVPLAHPAADHGGGALRTARYEVLFLDLPFFAAATFSVVVFYVASQREQGRRAGSA